MKLEKLKAEEFDAHIKNGTCRIAFVGMSNAGKSYRASVLNKEADLLWYQVDQEIEKKLGFKDMDEAAQWMGYPASDAYKERERKYLELEQEYTERAAMQTHGRNLVFDTTGSVIHLREETLNILYANCLVVHLDVGDDSLPRMIELFFKEPKTIVWGEHFSMQPEESEESALRRCYPGLLKTRLLKYRAIAHVNIPVGELFDKSAKETLTIIRSYLE